MSGKNLVYCFLISSTIGFFSEIVSLYYEEALTLPRLPKREVYNSFFFERFLAWGIIYFLIFNFILESSLFFLQRILIILSIGILGILCYLDLIFQRLPVLLLLSFYLLGVIGHSENSFWQECFLAILTLITCLFFKGVNYFLQRKKKNKNLAHSLIGNGDILLMAGLIIWLPLESLPFFFCSSGIIGILFAVFKKRSPQNFYLNSNLPPYCFPFVPALVIGFLMAYKIF